MKISGISIGDELLTDYEGTRQNKERDSTHLDFNVDLLGLHGRAVRKLGSLPQVLRLCFGRVVVHIVVTVRPQLDGIVGTHRSVRRGVVVAVVSRLIIRLRTEINIML